MHEIFYIKNKDESRLYSKNVDFEVDLNIIKMDGLIDDVGIYIDPDMVTDDEFFSLLSIRVNQKSLDGLKQLGDRYAVTDFFNCLELAEIIQSRFG